MVLLTMFGLNRIENAIESNYDWNTNWPFHLIQGIVIILFTYARLKYYERISTRKNHFLFITDILFLILYLFFSFQLAEDIFTADAAPYFTAVQSFRFLAYFVAVRKVYINWYFQLLTILFIFFIIVIQVIRHYPGENTSWVLALVSMLLAFSFNYVMVELDTKGDFKRKYEAIEKEKTWKELLGYIPDGVMIMNQKGEVRYMNSPFCKMLKVTKKGKLMKAADLNPKSDFIIEEFPADLKSKTKKIGNDFSSFLDILLEKWDNLSELFKDQKNANNFLPRYLDFLGKTNDSETVQRTIEIKVTFRNFESQKVCLILLSDITEKLIVSTLRDSIEYKNKLIESMSHELTAPINEHLNLIQTAHNSDNISKFCKEKFLEPALKSAKFLKTMLSDLLDLSQLDSNELKLNKTTKSIVQSIKESIKIIENEVIQKGLMLDLKLPANEWDAYVNTDHPRLQQILANLLTNALKFTSHGGITIFVTPDKENNFLIEVEDTGIGIKPEDKVELKKKYTAKIGVKDANIKGNKNSGLGLLISNALATRLGPKDPSKRGIKFESEVGKGSKFSFWIRNFSEKQAEIPVMMSTSELGDADLSLTSIDISVPEQKRNTPATILNNWITPKAKFFSPGSGTPVDDSINNSQASFLTHTQMNTQYMMTTQHSPRNGCRCADVVVVDDDPFQLLSLENLLGEFKLTVFPCYHGKEALKAVKERVLHPCCLQCKPFKMVFIDCNMPIIDGYECTKKMMEVFSEYPDSKCPIVGCAAQAQEKEKAGKSGMDSCCSKPFSKDELRDILRKFKLV